MGSDIMPIRGLMDKFKGGSDYVEVEHEEEQQSGPVTIEVERLETYSDSDRLQKKIREGSILLVKIRDLKTKDAEELKRAVERLRRTCLAVNGDIAGLGDDWLILTPASARVHREPREE